MARNYGETDWLGMSAEERIAPTKDLYRAFIFVAEHIGMRTDQLLDDALGEAQARGKDYIRNFRAGKISKVKAKAIHYWLAHRHFELSKARAPSLFPYRPESEWQAFLDLHAVTGRLRIVRLSKSMGIVQRAEDSTPAVETLRLTENFCFELVARQIGVAVAFQFHADKWHRLPLGTDGRRLTAKVRALKSLLPSNPDGTPIALVENDDAGHHQFAVIVSEGRTLATDMHELAQLGPDAPPFEVHLISVRFVT